MGLRPIARHVLTLTQAWGCLVSGIASRQYALYPITLIRHPKAVGLMGAKSAGANAAKGISIAKALHRHIYLRRRNKCIQPSRAAPQHHRSPGVPWAAPVRLPVHLSIRMSASPPSVRRPVCLSAPPPIRQHPHLLPICCAHAPALPMLVFANLWLGKSFLNSL